MASVDARRSEKSNPGAGACLPENLHSILAIAFPPLKTWLVTLCVLLSLFAGNSALALDPAEPGNDGYIRTHFANEDVLAGRVIDDIVQSKDGFLWLIVSGSKLTRFDGRNFESFNRPRNVLALASGPDGDLWIGTSTDLQRVPAAALNQFGDLPTTSYRLGSGNGSRINCLRFSRSGVLWVGSSEGLYRFEHGEFSAVIPGLTIHRIEEALNGHLLVITSQGFMEWDGARATPHPELAAQLGVGVEQIFHVLEDSHGVTWFCTAKGVARRIGGSIEKLATYGTGHEALRVYEDSRGQVWIGSTEGLFRVTANGLQVAASGMNVRYLYGDGDGNLWIGTNGDGLFRFKPSAVRMFTTADGLPNNVVMTVLARRDGALWAGANCGGLSRFDGRRFRTYNEKDGLLNTCVWALAEDAKGDLWIGTYGGGAFRMSGGNFTQFSTGQGLLSDRVTGVLPARDGSLWLATRGGLSCLRDGRIRNYTTTDGLSSNAVTKIYEDRTGGIWVGTRQGLDQMVGDRFVNVPSIPKSTVFPVGEDRSGGLYVSVDPNGGVFRIANSQTIYVAPNIEPTDMLDTQRGELWLAGTGILRVPESSLQRVHRPDEPLDSGVFGRDDGLTSPRASAGEPNLALASDGMLWIATAQGLAMLDLARLSITASTPHIYMQRVAVGRTSEAPGQSLVLPPGTHHVELHFAAVELSAPEKIRLQYRLDGVDSEWLDATFPSHAVYNDIPAGTHAFRVRASNRDGIWDRVGTVYYITQRPYFYQTRLFLLASLTAGVVLLVALYRLRLRQISRSISARFDARLDERTRLAREFHDTILQTLQGSKLVADHALEESDDPVRTQRALQQLSEWLDLAIQEGRAALNSLRTSTTEGNDLADALRRATESDSIPKAMAVKLCVVGDAREMHPVVRDEIYRIGYEAIRNASLHSSATQLEIELRYSQQLTLRVSDNGIGIDRAVQDKGKEGHFGLPGMRERAARIGGTLTVVSSATSGTEIMLVVPGGMVFRKKGTATLLGKLRPLFRRKRPTAKLDS